MSVNADASFNNFVVKKYGEVLTIFIFIKLALLQGAFYDCGCIIRKKYFNFFGNDRVLINIVVPYF